ncbi:MAG: hypothetical protein ACFFD4_34560 [Candidatus Odinarchaeota archaeon]
MKYSKELLVIIIGCVLISITAGTVLLGPAILGFVNNGESTNTTGNSKIWLGARIAEYMDYRESDIVFSWCFNNTFVNQNLTDHFGTFVDAVLFNGAPVDESTMNVSVIHHPAAINEQIDPTELAIVVNGIENALTGLEEVSTDIKDWNAIWPPTLLWDIAFDDGSALSLLYSREYRVITAINGTWSAGTWEHYGVVYPDFSFNTHSYETNYLVLDSEAVLLIEAAIESFYGLVISAFD